MTNLLEATNVSKTFSTGLIRKSINHALTDVSLAMGKRHPTILAVAGESGSGKTTLARILLHMTRPTSGEILVDGRNLLDINLGDWRHQIGVVDQNIVLLFQVLHIRHIHQ